MYRQVNYLRARNEALESRIRWLEATVANAGPELAGIGNISTGEQVSIRPFATPRPVSSPSASEETSGLTKSIIIPLLNIFRSENDLESQHSGPVGTGCEAFSAHPEWSSVSDVPELPCIESAMAICKAFLGSHKQSNHVVDEEELMQDLQKIYRPGGLSDRRFTHSRFRCFMVLYLAQEQYWTGNGMEDPGNALLRGIYRRLALKDASIVIGKEDLVRSLLTRQSSHCSSTI